MNIFWFLQPKIIYHSKIHGMLNIGKNAGNKALFSGDITQSGGEITPMYEEIATILKTTIAPPHTILVLGVGAGTFIHAIHKQFKNSFITGIEIDPQMLTIAKKHFGLKSSKHQHFFLQDAISYINHPKTSETFDLILVDLFIGRFNPKPARSQNFLRHLKKFLAPHGMILYNAHYQKQNIDEYNNFRKTADKIFVTVTEVFSYPLNRVLRMNS